MPHVRHILLASVTLLFTVWGAAGCLAPDDAFIKAVGVYPCQSNADCSEPGFVCVNGTCGNGFIDDFCVDLDGDGYGTNENRLGCTYPELDEDDTCAACTPEAQEVCDGFDNDTNGETDEPASCTGPLDCPQPPNAPVGAFMQCEASTCVLVPPLRAKGTPCENLTISCVNGAYDDTAARTNGCFVEMN